MITRLDIRGIILFVCETKHTRSKTYVYLVVDNGERIKGHRYKLFLKKFVYITSILHFLY